MDWDLAIERNRAALKRILAALFAMAGLSGAAALTSTTGSATRAGEAPRREASEPGEAGPTTLPRHLHRAVLRLLRPAEAAARRLVIVAARDVVVALPSRRPRRRKPKSAFLRNGRGTGIVLPPTVPHPEAGRRKTLSLPLLDPLPRFPPSRRAARAILRVSIPGVGMPSPIPVRRTPPPGDPIDATRLALRLQALTCLLDDLPKHARRFACWRLRRDAGRTRRRWPLRPGRAAGASAVERCRTARESHEVLADLHCLALTALALPDTS